MCSPRLFLFLEIKTISIVGNVQIFIDGEVDGGGHLRVVVGVVPYRDAAAAGLLADQREVVAAAVEGVVAAEVDKTVAALIAPVIALCGFAVLGEVKRASCTVPACTAVVGACVGGLRSGAAVAGVRFTVRCDFLPLLTANSSTLVMLLCIFSTMISLRNGDRLSR